MFRKMITAATVLGLAAACASNPSLESSNERLIRDLYDAFARGDLPTVLAAAIGRYTGTRATTRLPLDAQFVHVFKLRKGKITSFQQYTDTEQFVRLLSD